MFYRIILKYITLSAIIFGFPADLPSQVIKSPADTGAIQWGHSTFDRYTHQSMCEQALNGIIDLGDRTILPDMSIEDIMNVDVGPPNIPTQTTDAIYQCISKVKVDSIDKSQLLSYANALSALGKFDEAKEALDLLYHYHASDSLLQQDVLLSGFAMFLRSSQQGYMEITHEYLGRIDALSKSPVPSSVIARLQLMTYWYKQYESDSVRKYAHEIIALFPRMSDANILRTPATAAFEALITLANNEGDISEQQFWLDSMVSGLGDIASDQISRRKYTLQRAIDFRRSLYGNKANQIDVGMWFNHNGILRPSPGIMSLLVYVDHACLKRECVNQLQSLRKISLVNNLHITLITPTSGFIPGSLVLEPEEEGKASVKYFTDVWKLPHTVLLDIRPTSVLEDGRIIRGPGPISDMFSEWGGGVNALLTDMQGRLQWMGSIRGENDVMALLWIIRRLGN